MKNTKKKQKRKSTEKEKKIKHCNDQAKLITASKLFKKLQMAENGCHYGRQFVFGLLR